MTGWTIEGERDRRYPRLLTSTRSGRTVPLLERMLADGSPLFDAGLVCPDGLKATIGEIREQPWSEEFHAKLLQVADMHLAATAYL